MSVDEVKAQTLAYRQVACLLASNSIQRTRAAASQSSEDSDAGASDEISLLDWRYCPPDVEVTQYFLPKHPGFISASLLPLVSQTDDEEKEKQKVEDPSSAAPKKEVYFPICQECGGALQPGYGGTSIRVHSTSKLSRSQRRRASRRKAATLRKSKRDRKQQQPGNKNSKPRSNLWQYIQDPKRTVFDCCKNYITLTCGYCGATSRLPGQSNPKPERKPQQGNKKHDDRPVKARTGGVDAKLFGNKRQRVSFNNADQSTKGATTSSDANAADNEEEFLSLAPASAAAAPPKRTKEPPKLGQPKKKKKKKTGDLMNFLSSLNDC